MVGCDLNCVTTERVSQFYIASSDFMKPKEIRTITSHVEYNTVYFIVNPTSSIE